MLAATLTLGTSAFAQPSQYSSFDAPKAGREPNQGTFPTAINQQGWIGGTLVDNANLAKAFLRPPNGAYIMVVPPGSFQSFVAAINSSAEVVGFFYSTTATYGFLRDASGNYTLLAISGAYTTTAAGVNDAGMVVGYASLTTGNIGFLWDKQDGYTQFEVPGSKPGTTYALAINNSGVVTGYYYDDNDYTHGFIRSSSGEFSTFELSQGTETESTAINASGQVTGWGNEGEGETFGFVANTHGVIGTFGIAGSPGNAGVAINDSGVIVGYEFSDGGGNASFERDQSGNVTVLQIPFPNTANQPSGINSRGDITGYYTDSAGVNHGWVGIP